MSVVDDVQEVYTRYAQAFIRTGNAKLAARVAGVDPELIDEFVEKAEKNLDVQQMISDDATSVPDFDDVEETKKWVLERLAREASYKGPGSNQNARITALDKIAGLTNIQPAKKVDINSGKGGLLLVPVTSVEDWEKEAKDSQEKLLATARGE